MDYSVIILAAGKGSRTGLKYNKMFFEIEPNVKVIEKTLLPFLNDADCKQIVLVVSENDKQDMEKLVGKQINFKKIDFVLGGKERQDSVYNGLQKINEDFVMIHDGARCYIDEMLIDRIKKAMKNEQAGLLMVDSVDTVKVVEEGYVIETLIRSKLKCAQTPQVFKTELIKEVHEKAKNVDFTFSDDASMVEKLSNVKVKAIPGEYYNKKITTTEDVDKNLYKNH